MLHRDDRPEHYLDVYQNCRLFPNQDEAGTPVRASIFSAIVMQAQETTKLQVEVDPDSHSKNLGVILHCINDNVNCCSIIMYVTTGIMCLCTTAVTSTSIIGYIDRFHLHHLPIRQH